MKPQIPTSKFQRNTKPQAPIASRSFGVWSLGLPWMLELGAWSF